MYEMNEVKDIPNVQRRSGNRVNQLRAFIDSGKQQVELKGVPEREVTRVYNGLVQASVRPEFKGLVTARRIGKTIYLIRSR